MITQTREFTLMITRGYSHDYEGMVLNNYEGEGTVFITRESTLMITSRRVKGTLMTTRGGYSNDYE